MQSKGAAEEWSAALFLYELREKCFHGMQSRSALKCGLCILFYVAENPKEDPKEGPKEGPWARNKADRE